MPLPSISISTDAASVGAPSCPLSGAADLGGSPGSANAGPFSVLLDNVAPEPIAPADATPAVDTTDDKTDTDPAAPSADQLAAMGAFLLPQSTPPIPPKPAETDINALGSGAVGSTSTPGLPSGTPAASKGTGTPGKIFPGRCAAEKNLAVSAKAIQAQRASRPSSSETPSPSPAAAEESNQPAVSENPVRNLLADGYATIEYQMMAGQLTPVTPGSNLPAGTTPGTANNAANSLSPLFGGRIFRGRERLTGMSASDSAPAPEAGTSVTEPGTLPLPFSGAKDVSGANAPIPTPSVGTNEGSKTMVEAAETTDTFESDARALATATATQTLAAAAQSASSNGGQTQPSASAVNLPQAKIAAGAAELSVATSAGVKASIEPRKNNFLNVGSQKVDSSRTSVGTRAANRESAMPSTVPTTSASAREAEGFSSITTTAGITNGAGQSATPEKSAEAPVASHAAQVVREIHDIADGLWAVERNSVEVKFNFGGAQHLSVRVDYREGTVHATFRTNSADLRDALAQEWQAQGVSADVKPYQIADPVFTAAPVQSSVSSGQEFSLGGDNSRQQHSASEQPASFGGGSNFFGGSRSGNSTTVDTALAPSRVVRPDTALHLHAFA
jgi:hypothetical protein